MENIDDSDPIPIETPERDFSVGASGLVSRTFSLWLRRLGSYVVLVGLVASILATINTLIAFLLVPSDPSAFTDLIGTNPLDIITKLIGWTTVSDVILLTIAVALSIVGFIVMAVAYGAGIKLALEDYGNPGGGTVKEAFSYARGRLVTLIGANLLYSILIVIPIFPGIVGFAISALTIDWMDFSTYGPVLVTIPVLLVGLLIMLYLSIRLSPTIAVAVAEEDKNSVDAVKRAWQITQSNFWHIFLGFFLLVIITGIAAIIITISFAPIVLINVGLLVICTIAIALVLSPISAIFQAVLYRDLESRAKQTEADWW